MILEFKNNYSGLSDRQLVEMVTKPAEKEAPNEEAVAYLLYKKYSPLLHGLYNIHYKNIRGNCYEDCVEDLYTYLREGSPLWSKLHSITWSGSFSSWLRRTAYRRFKEVKSEMIGKLPQAPLSSEGKDVNAPTEDGIDTIIRRERKIRLLEAINNLEDDDLRMVMIKRLEGYKSKEIAELMKIKWESEGIVKYGYVKVEGQKNRVRKKVVPDEDYVNNLFDQAKNILRKVLS